MRTAFCIFAIILIGLPVQAARGEQSGSRITFVAFYNDAPVSYKTNIMTMNPDGSDVQQLTSLDRERGFSTFNCDCVITWSPDHKHLLYTITGFRSAHTWLIGANGQSEQSYDSAYYQFKWSPDGKHLAYLLQKDEYTGELYIAEADGKAPHSFTDRTVSDFDWSPDGTQIVISSLGNIYISPVEGAPILERVATNYLNAYVLNWSPDGARISFIYRLTLYVVDIKSRVRQKISDTVSHYVWSHDGHSILANHTIFDTINGSQRIVPDSTDDNEWGVQVWSPNDSAILYRKDENRAPGWLFVWDLSANRATKLTLLTDNVYSSDVWDAVWSPDGTQIAYLVRGQLCIINVDNTENHCISNLDNYGYIVRIQWA